MKVFTKEIILAVNHFKDLDATNIVIAAMDDGSIYDVHCRVVDEVDANEYSDYIEFNSSTSKTELVKLAATLKSELEDRFIRHRLFRSRRFALYWD